MFIASLVKLSTEVVASREERRRCQWGWQRMLIEDSSDFKRSKLVEVFSLELTNEVIFNSKFVGIQLLRYLSRQYCTRFSYTFLLFSAEISASWKFLINWETSDCLFWIFSDYEFLIKDPILLSMLSWNEFSLEKMKKIMNASSWRLGSLRYRTYQTLLSSLLSESRR